MRRRQLERLNLMQAVRIARAASAEDYAEAVTDLAREALEE